jgi:glutamate/tyrosine decarboxylase-like PLP-dependent enzyme
LSADVEAMQKAIGPNTIGIFASAPNWPYGQVDPITELGRVAQEKDLWLHVDACVGGYILPFMRELGEEIPPYDFSVPGVRSISADLHKYAYAPKPCSSILWRSQEEQSYHFVPVTEWPCGLYISQSMIGSRSMGPVAGAWALMHYWGREGYLDNARRILEVKKTIIERCDAIEGLKTWKTQGPLLMIASDDFDIQLVVGGMAERGWPVLGVIDPPAIHLTLDAMEEEMLQDLLQDLDDVCANIRSGKLTQEGLLSYGGIGAGDSAPKWLRSAAEIFGRQQSE